MRFFLALLIISCGAPVALAQTIELTTDKRQHVEGRLKYIRDESNALTIAEVSRMRLSKISDNKAPNFGFDRTTYWFRIDLLNHTDREDWLLEIDFAPIDSIDFYIESGGAWMHKTDGDMLPIAVRDIRHRQPIFSFNLPEGQPTAIYLRVKTTSSVQLPITLWQRSEFFHASFKIQLFNGLFFGAMVLMTLYQLFLFFSVRDRITFYYVLTLLSMTTIIAFFHGYTFLYLYPNQPVFNDLFAMFIGPIFMFFSTLLTRAFLKLREFNPALDNLLLANTFVDGLIGIFMVIFFRQISYQYHHYFMLSHCAISLVSAGYCLYRKFRPAMYYLIAWMTLLLATSFFTISNLGFIPGYMSTNYLGLMVGCILQVLFISFALGERLNVLTKENQRAKELELIRGLQENERLELEVKARTRIIQKQKEKLEETNRIKDKLFSVVSHDIKGPLSSLKLSLLLAKTGTLKPEEFNHVVSGIETHMVQTSEFIENLLQWARIQLRGISYEPSDVELKALVEETFTLLDPEFQAKKITITKAGFDAPLTAHIDPNMIRSVLRNLLTNAIKFTSQGGNIAVRTTSDEKFQIISITDTGVGIPESHRSRIFTLDSIITKGTKQEAGTGLGLILCKEFVEKNKGNIWFESEEGFGTTFYFSLPKFQVEDDHHEDASLAAHE
jgi:two-component system, sensor histidine kinase LadS